MKESLQALLKRKRDLLQLSQQEIADQAGITRQFYGMVECGERKPSVPVAQKLAIVLEVEWTVFFESESNLKLLINKIS
ncbi:helix-turn-helix transcriptional regulator [Jeotgalibacillus alimentarius]|uniref:helix-turn-helix transcriptional regulator n=1 Tax=Jeotgalibacillus alimentarius TaxID=135826 RepID=UPI000596F317|nr:helix-turn-helix transcriptional regulator [Jeotgalibacillus alimentarius]